MEKIVLTSPIMIDGKEVKELSYNADEITVEQFQEAELYKNKSMVSKGSTALAMEMDYTFQLYLGFMAIIAVNPSYDVHDLERMKGKDIRKVVIIGRNFTNGVEVAD